MLKSKKNKKKEKGKNRPYARPKTVASDISRNMDPMGTPIADMFAAPKGDVTSS